MNGSKLNKRTKGYGEYDFSTPEAIMRLFMLSYIKRDNILLERISKGQFLRIANTTDVDPHMLCSVIGLHTKTFLAKETDDLFCNSISENVIELLEVYSCGYKQCIDPIFFHCWMKDTNLSLSSVSPLLHCRDQIGRMEVCREISGLNQQGCQKKPDQT